MVSRLRELEAAAEHAWDLHQQTKETAARLERKVANAAAAYDLAVKAHAIALEEIDQTETAARTASDDLARYITQLADPDAEREPPGPRVVAQARAAQAHIDATNLGG